MRCPTCNKLVEWQDNASRPFCSERCKLIDFGRWANEEFRVPVEATNPDDMIEPPSQPTSPDGETTSH